MTPTRTRNPFRPGNGQSPPYLAGRENEQGRLREILAEMSAGESPAADMVMYGPRGMGKTVLLSWFEDEAKESGTKDNPIRTSWTTPNKLASPADMWGYLLSREWKQRLMPSRLLPSRVIAKVALLSAIWESSAAASPALVNTLIKECKNRPLVFLMDEAHTMEPGLCRSLLNLSQEIRKEAPFLLVLAGTPGLEHFLTTVNASFVERSNKIGIARLDTVAAGAAIEKPLNEHGIKITADALARVVEDSQCYPYFVQQWGQSLWDEANKAKLTELTDEQVDIAEPSVNSAKQNFYAGRWSRLFQDKLLPVAQIIAAAFQDTPQYKEIDLVLLIRDALPADQAEDQHIASLLQALTRQDFVWRPPGTDLYEPGIPSLMTYVLDQQREAG